MEVQDENRTACCSQDNTSPSDTTVPNLEHKYSNAGNLIVTVAFYYQLFVLIMGLFGNTATLLLIGKTKTPVTTRIILSCLAISDNLFLVYGVLPIVVYKYFGLVLQNISQISCSIWAFVRFLFTAMSVWLLAILTIERALVVAFPFKQNLYISKKRLYVILTITFLSHIGWCLFVAFGYSMTNIFDDEDNLIATVCHPGSNMRIIYPVRIIGDQLVPVICVVLGNIVISVCFWRNSRQLSSQATANRASDSKLLVTTCFVPRHRWKGFSR